MAAVPQDRTAVEVLRIYKELAITGPDSEISRHLNSAGDTSPALASIRKCARLTTLIELLAYGTAKLNSNSRWIDLRSHC